MMKRNSKARFSKRRLRQLINELVGLAKDLCPEAKVVELRVPGYEELDAMLEIVVPDSDEENVHNSVSRRAYEIFMSEGYDIGVSVLSRSDYERIKAKVKSWA